MTKKKTTKKKAEKVVKKVAEKVASKKITKKNVAKKKSTPKKAAKKATKKTAAKKTQKKDSTSQKVAKKKVSKKPAAKKKVAKKTTTKTVEKKVVGKKTRRRRSISVAEAAREAETDGRGFVYINGRKVRLIETKGLSKKKKRPAAKTIEPKANTHIQLKSTLTTKQLREYRERLMTYRARLLTDLGAIEKEALNANSDSSHMPMHMADVGSDAYEQDLKLGLAASERRRIRDIEEALVRIKKKTYGVCHMTGMQIPEARLHAKPWAKYTKESAEKYERANPRR